MKNQTFNNEDLSLIYQARNYKKYKLSNDIKISLKILNYLLKENNINFKDIGIKRVNTKIFKNLKNKNIYINYLDIYFSKPINLLKEIDEVDKKIKIIKLNSNNKYLLIENLNVIELNIKCKNPINKRFGASIKIALIKLFINYYILIFSEIINKYLKTIKTKNKLVKFSRKVKLLIWKILQILHLNNLAFDYRYKLISEDYFRKLLLIDCNELNFSIRKSHFQLITNNFKLNTIDEIIKWHSEKYNAKLVASKSIQPRNIKVHDFPKHLDKVFWGNGNSYFYNCFKYQFRKDIIDYFSIQSMLSKELLIYFSEDYYTSKVKMKDKEIKNFLKKNPIIINENAIGSGRHRVCAMIGRLIEGYDYIPFYYPRF